MLTGLDYHGGLPGPDAEPAWVRLCRRMPDTYSRLRWSTLAAFAGYANGQLERMVSYSPAIQSEIDSLQTKLETCGWHLRMAARRRRSERMG